MKDINDFKLKMGIWGRYDYLSKKDSDLYDRLKESKDKKDKLIVKMIIEKAYECYTSHCQQLK